MLRIDRNLRHSETNHNDKQSYCDVVVIVS
jgi:hypothetical protein